ncbi:hypothetical protein GCM10022293_32750 [Azospirillum formosense]
MGKAWGGAGGEVRKINMAPTRPPTTTIDAFSSKKLSNLPDAASGCRLADGAAGGQKVSSSITQQSMERCANAPQTLSTWVRVKGPTPIW